MQIKAELRYMHTSFKSFPQCIKLQLKPFGPGTHMQSNAYSLTI